MPQHTASACRIFLLILTLPTVSACAVTPAGSKGEFQHRETNVQRPVDEHLIKPDIELDARPDDSSHNDAQYRLARSRVEAATNTDLSHVDLRIVSDALIDHEVSLETARLVDSQFASPAFRAHFLNSIMGEQSGTYAALYSHRHSAILVSRTLLNSLLDSVPTHGDVRDATLMALLIHELVHAADDVRHDIQSQRTLSFRASFAQSATFEGHAQWQTRKICEEHACLSGLQALDEFMFGRDEPLDHSLPAVQAISRNVLEYSYIEGERFVAAIAARPEGEALLEQLLSSPPRDPVQILAPLSFPDNEREERNQRLIKAAQNADHPWTTSPWRVLETSPLKGVNLREDPDRRQAAIDGFTRLITAIVAVQLYDETEPERAPVEATLIRATNDVTAQLFATSLHNNTRSPEALLSSRPISALRSSNVEPPVSVAISGTLYETRLMEPPMGDPTDPSWRTAIAVSGQHVIQISGLADNDQALQRYVIAVLAELADPMQLSTNSH